MKSPSNKIYEMILQQHVITDYTFNVVAKNYDKAEEEAWKIIHTEGPCPGYVETKTKIEAEYTIGCSTEEEE